MVNSIVTLNQRRIKMLIPGMLKSKYDVKGKLEIVRFNSASKVRDRWCSSKVIWQAFPYRRYGTTNGV